MTKEPSQFETGDESLVAKIPAFLRKNLRPGKTDFEVVAWIPVLYQGWELDDWAVIIRVDGQKILLHTDHGSLYRVEDPKEFLGDKIALYREAIEKCELASKSL